MREEDDAAHLPPHRVLYLCTGSQGEQRAALARIAEGENRNIALGEGDTVIFSSRIIPGNELADLRATERASAASGVAVITERDHFVHVSGHPARDELATMYSWLKPRIAIPVHGELRHTMEHALRRKPAGARNDCGRERRHGAACAEKPRSSTRLPAWTAFPRRQDLLFTKKTAIPARRRSLGFLGLHRHYADLRRQGVFAADPVFHIEGIPEAVVETRAFGGARRADGKRRGGRIMETVRIAARRAAADAWNKKPLVRVRTGRAVMNACLDTRCSASISLSGGPSCSPFCLSA